MLPNNFQISLENPLAQPNVQPPSAQYAATFTEEYDSRTITLNGYMAMRDMHVHKLHQLRNKLNSEPLAAAGLRTMLETVDNTVERLSKQIEVLQVSCANSPTALLENEQIWVTASEPKKTRMVIGTPRTRTCRCHAQITAGRASSSGC